MGSLFRSAKKCGLKVFVSSLSLISWPEASIFLLVLPRSKEPEMFSIITEAHHQLPPASRSSSDRSDSSTGGQPVSMMPSAKTEAKMFGSNLYWEEEVKNSSTTLPLDLDLSLDLAKKLLLADQTMGLESTQMCGSTFQSQGSAGAANSASNPRFKTEICRNFKEKGNCLYGELCQFAHGKHELRKDVIRHNKYKTKLCQKYWINGYCAYGPRCNFIHDTDRRHAMTNQSGNITGLRAPGNIPTAYYKTAAEVIAAAVKKSNLAETGGESSGSDEGGNRGAPFVFSNPYRDGGNLMGLDKFPTFFPRGYNQGEITPRPPCGPIGSGRPSEKMTTPGV